MIRLTLPGNNSVSTKTLFWPLVFGLAILSGGCATSAYNLATEKEEISFYSTEKEVNLGKSLARAVEKRYQVVPDVPLQDRVRDIGQKIAEVCDRRDITYHFTVIKDPDVNAFALPGGFVYVTSELVDTAKNDDEIACAVAHEVGHIAARHGIKRIQANWGTTILRILAAQESARDRRDVDEALSSLILKYSREDEILADRLAVKYALGAGYDPKAMLTFLARLREIQYRKPIEPKNRLQTHPYLGDRMRAVKAEIGLPLDFLDYVNSGYDLD